MAMGLAVLAAVGVHEAGLGSDQGWKGTEAAKAPVDREVHAHLETADFALG
jgi:hypothetical protein